MNGGKTDLHIALKSNGETYPKLVENLKGQVLLVIGQSRLQAGALKYIKGNFISQLLSALHLQAKEPTMSMKCAVLLAIGVKMCYNTNILCPKADEVGCKGI